MKKAFSLSAGVLLYVKVRENDLFAEINARKCLAVLAEI